MTVPVTIGADPEWGVMSQDGETLQNPGDYISVAAGTDAGFGIDGSSRVAELRPSYSSTPRGLVANIKDLLQFGITRYPGLRSCKWKAGSMAGDEPIGGHIHFGHPNLCQPGGGNFKAPDMRNKVVSALSHILAPLCLMAEDKDEAIARRVGTSYGDARVEAAQRQQSYGVEYRPLSSWLTSPHDALSVLSVGHLIVSNLDNDEFIKFSNALPEMDDESYRDCNKKIASFYLKGIAKALKMCKGFKDYLKDMEPLFDLVIEGKSFNVNQDMKVSWGLTYEPVPATQLANQMRLV